MSGKKETNSKEKIILAALGLAAAQGWENVTLPEIAAAAGLELVAVHDYFEDKSDILNGFGRMVDRRILDDVSGEGESARERLFDILMDRFEVLNEHRAGVVAILESLQCDPKQAVIGCPHLARSMGWMLEAAGLSTSGWRGAMRVAGLTALYLKTLRVWMRDESSDLGKVMAALDQDLAVVEKWAGSLGF